MMDFGNTLSLIDSAFKSGRDFIGLLNDVKSLLNRDGPNSTAMNMPPQMGAQWHMPAMQPFTPQFQDPFSGGAQWMPQLQQIAQRNGNPWVPTQVHDLGGINLTGVWCPPVNPFDQTYIRQFGPYLNIIAGINGMPTLYAEGLFNPLQSSIYARGQYINNTPMEAQLTLASNWTLQGILTTMTVFGMPSHMPIMMGKVA
jgi:hypothetical protein